MCDEAGTVWEGELLDCKGVDLFAKPTSHLASSDLFLNRYPKIGWRRK